MSKAFEVGKKAGGTVQGRKEHPRRRRRFTAPILCLVEAGGPPGAGPQDGGDGRHPRKK